MPGDFSEKFKRGVTELLTLLLLLLLSSDKCKFLVNFVLFHPRGIWLHTCTKAGERFFEPCINFSLVMSMVSAGWRLGVISSVVWKAVGLKAAGDVDSRGCSGTRGG